MGFPIHRRIVDKHCFMPCPPDKCDCRSGNPAEWLAQTIRDRAIVKKGYNLLFSFAHTEQKYLIEKPSLMAEFIEQFSNFSPLRLVMVKEEGKPDKALIVHDSDIVIGEILSIDGRPEVMTNVTDGTDEAALWVGLGGALNAATSQINSIWTNLHVAIANAARAGFVISVDLVNQQPLAMGNYKMVPSMRRARHLGEHPLTVKYKKE